jgi:hypothetical protein
LRLISTAYAEAFATAGHPSHGLEGVAIPACSAAAGRVRETGGAVEAVRLAALDAVAAVAFGWIRGALGIGAAASANVNAVVAVASVEIDRGVETAESAAFRAAATSTFGMSGAGGVRAAASAGALR